MNIDINVKDFDRTHRIGAKAENKRRPTTVKFVRYSERQKVFNNKERFKGKNFYITESLTKKYGFRNVCIFAGKILYNVDDTPNSKPEVYYQ